MTLGSEPRRLVFATQELDPIVPGGAGAVVSGLAARLAAAHDVTVVLATWEQFGTPDLPFGLVRVELEAPDGSAEWFVERARRVSEALVGLAAESAVDLVEFCDFEGLGFWSLANRADLGLHRTRLAVRVHGPVNVLAMDGLMGPPPGRPMDVLAEMERLSLEMADVVVVPTQGEARWVGERFGIEPDRLVVAPPPVPDVAPVRWAPSPDPSLAMFGRLADQKGPHDLMRAVLPLFDSHPGLRLRMIGPDGWSMAEDRPMTEVLADMIPGRHRDRVEFAGRMERSEAMRSLASAWAVVLPSRYESFCLAAHEVRRAGLPVIVPDLPPFEGYGEDVGLLRYDGTIDGLTRTLDGVVRDRSLVEALVGRPAPVVAEATAAYEGPLPEIRHPNSQAGLGTKAAKELERLLAPPRSRLSQVAAVLLRVLPRPVARLAVRVLPQRVKDRFRSLASWPAEMARRERTEGLSELRRDIEAGRYAEDPNPTVSVVIPCYDQGEWVEDAVASVFRQSRRSWEIVLVDDGSTDGATVRLLDELATWPRIRLVRQANAGLPAARNAGIAESAGEFVVPLDADDEIDPDFLAVMIDALGAHPEAAFAHCWAELFGDVSALWVPRPYNRYWQRLSNGIVGCVLLRRSAWVAAGGYDETMTNGHEDWELWLRLDAAGWDQVQVRRPLFRYRKHGVSMSVESEARFEQGRAEIRARNPELYAREALAALKAEEYPFVSLLSDEPAAGRPPVDDAEWVARVGDARGKFVTVVDDPARAHEVIGVAERLEQSPQRAFGVSDSGLVVWRRWCLLDPHASPRGGLDGEAESPDGWSLGEFADEQWTVQPDAVPDDLRLMRQRPEEAGRLPEVWS